MHELPMKHTLGQLFKAACCMLAAYLCFLFPRIIFKRLAYNGPGLCSWPDMTLNEIDNTELKL